MDLSNSQNKNKPSRQCDTIRHEIFCLLKIYIRSIGMVRHININSTKAQINCTKDLNCFWSFLWVPKIQCDIRFTTFDKEQKKKENIARKQMRTTLNTLYWQERLSASENERDRENGIAIFIICHFRFFGVRQAK